MRKACFITAEDAVKLVKNNDAVIIGGSGGTILEADLLLQKLGEKYTNTNSPRNLTLIHVTGIGDRGVKGLGYLAHEGLVKRIIGGHWGMAPMMAKLAQDNKIEAYNLPQGVMSQMFRAMAGKKPGIITHVGLNTFIDPRIEGGKLNSVTVEDIVKVIEIDGEEKLLYKPFPADIAFIRGTTADKKGNITLEQEAATLENLSIAQAVKNGGGIVIAQVKRRSSELLNARNIVVPSIYIDYIVVHEKQWQTCVCEYNPSFSGEIRLPLEDLEKIALDVRKVIARRAALEIRRNSVVNLGVGIPANIAAVIAEEGTSEEITLNVEQGLIGGVPSGGVVFGASSNPDAMIDQAYQFDFFDGGGLDVACLGMAQTDCLGNVNVSKFGSVLAGCGGFINISQNTKKVIFCGTFTSGGFEAKVDMDRLIINKEGQIKKFVDCVDQITFSGKYSIKNGQEVFYVTERAVFTLTEQGVKLIEIAPGIDLEKDVLSHMDFVPIIDDDLKQMKSYIFNEKLMNLNNIMK